MLVGWATILFSCIKATFKSVGRTKGIKFERQKKITSLIYLNQNVQNGFPAISCAITNDDNYSSWFNLTLEQNLKLNSL